MNTKNRINTLLAALALVLAACTESEELTTPAFAPVVISTDMPAGLTRAVKESFALGDEITITYDKEYPYVLAYTGWHPVGDALMLPTSGNVEVSASYEEAGSTTPMAAEAKTTAGTIRPTVASDGSRAWAVSLRFKHQWGAINLTLLDEMLTPITEFKTVKIHGEEIKSVTKAHGLMGIMLKPGTITKIEVDTDGDDTIDYSATLNDNRTVVAGQLHEMTVVLTKTPVTP